MSLNQWIDEYKQKDGLIVPKSEKKGQESIDTTGDGLKHFSQYHALLVRRGESRTEHLIEFEHVVSNCYAEKIKGLLNRSPTKKEEQISHEAIVAVTYAAKLLKSRVRVDIFKYGHRSKFLFLKWFYPNTRPNILNDIVPLKELLNIHFWKAWFGKNPEAIAHIQWCVGFRPNPIRQILQGIYFIFVTTKHSGLNTTNYMMSEACADKNILLDMCLEFWRWRVGDIKKSLIDELEEEHPIVKYWVD